MGFGHLVGLLIILLMIHISLAHQKSLMYVWTLFCCSKPQSSFTYWSLNHHSCALQIVVLARVIVDEDQVLLTARGITLLVDKLNSEDDKVIILACSLLSSLAHTRAGIPDAMITSGAIDVLVKHLFSTVDLVWQFILVFILNLFLYYNVFFIFIRFELFLNLRVNNKYFKN